MRRKLKGLSFDIDVSCGSPVTFANKCILSYGYSNNKIMTQLTCAVYGRRLTFPCLNTVIIVTVAAKVVYNSGRD